MSGLCAIGPENEFTSYKLSHRGRRITDSWGERMGST